MARNCNAPVIAMQIRHEAVEDRCLSRGVAAFIDFTAKAKLVRFESAGTFALHTFPFGFKGNAIQNAHHCLVRRWRDGDPKDRSLLGRGAVSSYTAI